jgi:diguanylate cyclase (GGDEF)-like protein/PAS domain S-box-containing protein
MSARAEEARITRVNSDKQYRSIFDSVGDGIFVCDAKTGAFIDVNVAGCRMLGLSRGALIGQTIAAIATGRSPYLERDAMAWFQRARSHGPQLFEWCCKAPDDGLIWGEISLRCVSLGRRPVGLAILRDITERKRKDAEVALQAHFDVLTGLPNRRNFDVVLLQEISRSARYGGLLCLAMADIDLFKDVNDTFGHQAGDAVLKTIADLLRKSLRRSDYMARWGGEEFTLLLPETALDVSEMLLNRLRLCIAGEVIPEIGRAVTLSFGVTAFAKSDKPDDLLNRVDQALYRSKQTGRNKVTKI